jgi:hypothetical protein
MLIEDRRPADGGRSVNIIEAQEILRLAQSLYLQRDYSLALEMIEQALDILEESGD